MTNLKEVMRRAHKLAKTFTGNYQARLALALKIAWAPVKKGVSKMVELMGSEKQVQWAEDIRKEMLEVVNSVIAKVEKATFKREIFKEKAEKELSIVKNFIENQSSSKYFIENWKHMTKTNEDLNRSMLMFLSEELNGERQIHFIRQI